MTAETKDAPAPELAIAPARDLLKEAMVAIQVKLKNFPHSSAAMLSLTWTGMPPASNAVLSAVLRGLMRPSSSPIAVVLIRSSPLDSSVCHQDGIDESEPAKYTLWTESLRKNVDMANAI